MIQECVKDNIPILILVKPNTKLAFIDGLQEDHEQLLKSEYTMDNLFEVVRQGIEYLSDFMNTRFTMLMPPDIGKYLDNVSAKGVNRSEYIRKLIRVDMKREGI